LVLEVQSSVCGRRESKGGPDALDRVWKKTIERKNDFMLSPIAHEGLREGHRVAADTTEAAFALCSLHVYDYSHALIPTFFPCDGIF